MAKRWMMVMNDGETYSPVEECTVVLVDVGDGFEGDAVDQRVKEAVRSGYGYEVCVHEETHGEAIEPGSIFLPPIEGESEDGS